MKRLLRRNHWLDVFMQVNSSGFFRNSINRLRYFTWPLKLLIRELKMYFRLPFFRKWRERTRVTFPNLNSPSNHNDLRSAMEFNSFLRDLSYETYYSYVIFSETSSLRTFSGRLSTNEMMAFPKFFGIFLVSFLDNTF